MISAAQKQDAKYVLGKTLCINRKYTCHNLLKLLLQEFLLDHKPRKNSFPKSSPVPRSHQIFKVSLPTAERFKQ